MIRSYAMLLWLDINHDHTQLTLKFGKVKLVSFRRISASKLLNFLCLLDIKTALGQYPAEIAHKHLFHELKKISCNSPFLVQNASYNDCALFVQKNCIRANSTQCMTFRKGLLVVSYCWVLIELKIFFK